MPSSSILPFGKPLPGVPLVVKLQVEQSVLARAQRGGALLHHTHDQQARLSPAYRCSLESSTSTNCSFSTAQSGQSLRHGLFDHTSRNKVITRLMQGSRLIPVLAQTPGRDLSHTKGSVQRPELNL